MPHQDMLAAIDLGSNSFRLELGRMEHGQLVRTDYLKETVRQGGDLDAHRNLTPEAMERGWECLARFRERIHGLPARQVRAVATQTLREARNRDIFLNRAQQVLGYPIEIISGTEEARLIYIGVSQFLPNDGERRLVLDVGGRSTEMILGQNREPSVMNSYRVGSVSWSQKYFPQGQFTQQAFNQAKVAAQAVLEEALVMYPRDLWDKAYGASGTVGAVADVLQLAGWTPGQITRDGLAWLIQCVQAAQHFSRLRLEGLKEDRRAVIGGGLAVLAALFEQFDIEALHVAQGALRHGAMHELMERDHSEKDVRDASVHRLAEKFGVDRDQAKRVTDVALQLLAMMNPADNRAPHRIERKLAWACELHEIGLAISHSDHHKHGAYILDNADVMGFSQPELHRLSLLVLGHHGKLRKLDMDFEDSMVVQQLLALRLSVILCHSRRQPDMTGLQVHCEPEQKVFEWVCPSDWSQRFPQSHHLIQQEIVAWQKTPWTLRLRNNKVSP